jgi:hypothetical protein
MPTVQVCAHVTAARTCDSTRSDELETTRTSDELGTTLTSGDELLECTDFTTVSTASGGSVAVRSAGSVAVRMFMVLGGVMII